VLSPIVRSSDTASVKLTTVATADHKAGPPHSPIMEEKGEESARRRRNNNRNRSTNTERKDEEDEEDEEEEAVSSLSWSGSERERVRDSQQRLMERDHRHIRSPSQNHSGGDSGGLPEVSPHPPSLVQHPPLHRLRISNARNFVDNQSPHE
jgi:hypothetical protein